MKKRLLIVRNPDSPLLEYLNLEGKEQEIILVQNGVFSSKLREKGANILENDAKARKIGYNTNWVNYEKMLDSILSAEQIILI